MAKRKTIQQKEVEALTKKFLDELGRKITVVSSRNSKVSKLQKEHLRDSANWRVKPYNVVTVSQSFYGKYNTPKGKATPKNRNNIKDTPLLNSIEENTPPEVEVFVKDMIDLLMSPIVKK